MKQFLIHFFAVAWIGLVSYFEGATSLLITYALMAALNFSLGILQAIRAKDFHSHKLMHGIFKRVIWVMVVLLFWAIGKETGITALQKGGALIAIIYEFISCTENSKLMGFDVMKEITKVLGFAKAQKQRIDEYTK